MTFDVNKHSKFGHKFHPRVRTSSHYFKFPFMRRARAPSPPPCGRAPRWPLRERGGEGRRGKEEATKREEERGGRVKKRHCKARWWDGLRNFSLFAFFLLKVARNVEIKILIALVRSSVIRLDCDYKTKYAYGSNQTNLTQLHLLTHHINLYCQKFYPQLLIGNAHSLFFCG